MTVPTVELNTGHVIPAIGLGAFDRDSVGCKAWILTALKAGYRLIDTAWIYYTEKAVGEAIRESGIPRQELFITTKIPWHHYDRAAQSLEESLQNLGVDYVDLWLIHWPQTVPYVEGNPFPRNPDGTIQTVDTPTYQDVWADMEKCLSTGKVRAIGVSNFSIKTLEKLSETAKITPAVNQIELQPYLIQDELVEYCKKRGIVPMAYSPTGRDKVRGDPLIISLAEKYSVSPTQVICAWHVARGHVPVPKSANPDRQRDNINLPTLDAEDVKLISGLDRGERIVNKPDPVTGIMWGWTVEQLGW